MVLLLSQKALFKFYTLFFAVLLGLAAVFVNYYVTSHTDIYSYYHKAALGFELVPKNGPTLWMGMAVVQLIFGLGYIFLLNLQSMFAAVIVLDIMIPLWTLMIELPVDVRQLVAMFSGLVLGLNTAVCLAMKLKCFYYSCRYVYLLVRHMYRIYGLQLLLEDTWKRIRFPDVLRVFWLSRITAQALILVYVVRVARWESSKATGDTMDRSSDSQVGSQAITLLLIWLFLEKLMLLPLFHMDQAAITKAFIMAVALSSWKINHFCGGGFRHKMKVEFDINLFMFDAYNLV